MEGSLQIAQKAGAGSVETPAADDCSLVIELAYNGAPFNGFAKQKDQRLLTVQGELERALSTIFAHPVETVCAGRTDAGVHARKQFVSCAASRSELAGRNAHKLRVSLNALTPDSIAVHHVLYAAPGFSARFDAVKRVYRYRICTGPVPPLFLREFSWWYRGSLDADAMRAGAAHLVGEHDFKSFCKAQSAVGKTTMRFVESIGVRREEQMGEEHLVIEVVGNAFLHSMVRTIVGTLVQVGAGRKEASWVGEVLAACDRGAAGENAPACGLTFWDVVYPPGLVREEL